MEDGQVAVWRKEMPAALHCTHLAWQALHYNMYACCLCLLCDFPMDRWRQGGDSVMREERELSHYIIILSVVCMEN